MQVKQLNFEFPVLVIDDFLPAKQAEELLQECVDLKPMYQPATVVGEDGQPVTRPKFRQNDVVYLDQVFTGMRQNSKLISYLEQRIFRDNDTLALWCDHSILHTIKLASRNETVLSKYGNCNFYGWHADNAGAIPCQRMVTLVYYINSRPEQFTGGELMFAEKEKGKKTQTCVKPKHNRLVVFPSYAVHSVKNVRMKSKKPKMKDFRFSVNCWAGCNS